MSNCRPYFPTVTREYTAILTCTPCLDLTVIETPRPPLISGRNPACATTPSRDRRQADPEASVGCNDSTAPPAERQAPFLNFVAESLEFEP